MANCTKKDGKYEFDVTHGVIAFHYNNECYIEPIGDIKYWELAKICDAAFYDSIKKMSGENINKTIHYAKLLSHVCANCKKKSCNGCEYSMINQKKKNNSTWVGTIEVNGRKCNGAVVFGLENSEDETPIPIYGVGSFDSLDYLMMCKLVFETLERTVENNKSKEEYEQYISDVMSVFRHEESEREYTYIYNVIGIPDFIDRYNISDNKYCNLQKNKSRKFIHELFLSGILGTTCKTVLQVEALFALADHLGIKYDKTMPTEAYLFYECIYVKDGVLTGTNLLRSGCDHMVDMPTLMGIRGKRGDS